MGIIKKIFIAVLGFSFFLGGCAETDETGNLTTLDEFTTDVNRIAADQLTDASIEEIIPLHQVLSISKTKYAEADVNFVAAPFDWQQLIAMVATGAVGSTKDALSESIQLNLADNIQLENISAWQQAVASSSSVEQSFFIWGQEGYLFNENYLTRLIEIFGPQLFSVDFRFNLNQVGLDITSTLNLDGFYSLYGIDDRSRVIAAHKSIIDSGWSESLTATAELARFGNNNAQYWIDMVKLDGEMGFYQSGNFSSTIVPLQDEKLLLMLITPDNGYFESVLTSLSADLFNEILLNAITVSQSTYVPLSVIKHSSVSDTSFDVAADKFFADFSAVNNQGFLYLNQVKQEVQLSLTVDGIQSQSNTMGALSATADEPSFVFDDGDVTGGVTFVVGGFSNSGCYYPASAAPFIFVLYNSASNTILNSGRLVEVEGKFIDYEWSVFYTNECGISPPVDVYIAKGSLQCQYGSGTVHTVMQQTLIEAGIEVLYSYESNDGLIYTTVCDAADGVINVFTIREHQLDAAKALGFSILSDLIN